MRLKIAIGECVSPPATAANEVTIASAILSNVLL